MPKGNGKSIAKVPVHLNPSSTEKQALIDTLAQRFDEHKDRHSSVEWRIVLSRLEKQPDKLVSLYAMESTDGEPDVVLLGTDRKALVYVDCSPQSPNRRSICYDRDGELLREKKGLYPGGNAVDLATAMGIELLDEHQYRALQGLGEFDTTTSSWIRTPDAIRKLGGALFCDRRYDTVFTYHNGAESFYSARGFRGMLKI